MTVAELLARISSHELAEWQAFYQWRESQPKNGKPNPEAARESMLRRLREKRGG